MEWKDQYKHPLWQKKRLEALEAAGFECEDCGSKDNQLHVHHVRYKKNAKIWEYEVTELTVLCDNCHSVAHQSKDMLNDYFLMCGAGSERDVAELVSGWIGYEGMPEEFVKTHLEAVGYGAGYLQNLDVSTILKLTKIRPDDLKSFIDGY